MARYFSKLLNSEVMEDFRSGERESSERRLDPQLCEPISKNKIREFPKKMTNGKIEGPDQILVEVRKCLGEKGLEWLTEFFNVIFRTAKMSKEWRFSILIPLHKNKCDIQDCNNYRGIKLLSYTLSLIHI